MSGDRCIDIREIEPGTWRLEFPYEADFIAYVKSRVPSRDRSYDPDTNWWTVRGQQYMPEIEGIAAQKFDHATRIFRKDDETVWRNLITGHESVQKSLF
jgi:hypothetical protein